nr:CCA tRNA nucleotidyltransferase [Spirochaetaceae bacterium]
MNIRYPKEIQKIAELLYKAGYDSYLIGGAVRDQLLGKPAKDFDLTTNALPQEVMKLFKRVIPTGLKHGTVTVLMGELSVEVTTYRVDGKYSDGRRPDMIQFTPSIHEDLKRRDFTINSIGYHIIDGKMLDPNGGLDDLSRGIIRAIGNPMERFDEDGLRSIRACRFAAQLKFTIDDNTLEGIKNSLNRIPGLSKERIFDELIKICKTEKPSVSFILFKVTGILEILLPELFATLGIEQKGVHKYDVFYHSIYSMDGIPASEVEIRLAALFHDLGKTVTIQRDADGLITFYNHEKESVKLALKIMKNYRFPNSYIKKISHLIEQHMFHYESCWKDNTLRRFIFRVGLKNLEDLFLLR